MSLAEAWPHDFRIQALESLIDRLEEYLAVLTAQASRTLDPLRQQDPAVLRRKAGSSRRPRSGS